MTKIHAKRLLKLAAFLEKVPKKNFDFATFVEERGCGTVGCALGLAATMPEFKRLGAKIEKRKDYYGDTEMYVTVSGCEGYEAPNELAEVLFGIEGLHDFDRLFMPGPVSGLKPSATGAEVAANIRLFVEERCR